MNLIQKCICGSTNFFETTYKTVDFPLLACEDCGIIHQHLQYTKEEYRNFYTRYHRDFQEHINRQPFQERYEHDYEISKIRYKTYKDVLKNKNTILDVGASNGAFVDLMNRQSYDCEGIDIVNILNNKKIYTTDFLDIKKKYDCITMHDVFEHIPNIHDYMIHSKKILNPNGCLIIDVPDFFSKFGFHHWRKIEHIWYPNIYQLIEYFYSLDYEIMKLTFPVKGKNVFYLEL